MLAVVPGSASTSVTPSNSASTVRIPGAEVLGEAATVENGILQPPADLRGARAHPGRGTPHATLSRAAPFHFPSPHTRRHPCRRDHQQDGSVRGSQRPRIRGAHPQERAEQHQVCLFERQGPLPRLLRIEGARARRRARCTASLSGRGSIQAGDGQVGAARGAPRAAAARLHRAAPRGCGSARR